MGSVLSERFGASLGGSCDDADGFLDPLSYGYAVLARSDASPHTHSFIPLSFTASEVLRRRYARSRACVEFCAEPHAERRRGDRSIRPHREPRDELLGASLERDENGPRSRASLARCGGGSGPIRSPRWVQATHALARGPTKAHPRSRRAPGHRDGAASSDSRVQCASEDRHGARRGPRRGRSRNSEARCEHHRRHLGPEAGLGEYSAHTRAWLVLRSRRQGRARGHRANARSHFLQTTQDRSTRRARGSGPPRASRTRSHDSHRGLPRRRQSRSPRTARESARRRAPRPPAARFALA